MNIDSHGKNEDAINMYREKPCMLWKTGMTYLWGTLTQQRSRLDKHSKP